MANEFIIKNGFRSQGNSEVTGSFVNILTPTSLKIQSVLSSSILGGFLYTSGLGWNSIELSGSQTAFRSDTDTTLLNGIIQGNISLPAFGVSFPYKGNISTIVTGSDIVSVGTQQTDSTSIGGSVSLTTTQNGTFSGSYGKNEYLVAINKNYTTDESNLEIRKRNNAGETIALNLNSGADGFGVFSTLSQPTSSFLRLVSGSSNNLVDFRYDANYFKKKTFIGDIYPASQDAILQIKGAGTTPYTLGLNVTDTNDKPLLFVQDNGYVGINRVPFSLDTQAWWNLHVSGTIASNNYVIGSSMYVNAGVNPATSVGYPMLFKFTQSAVGYENVDFQIQSNPTLAPYGLSAGWSPLFTVKYDGKVGIGIDNTQPSASLHISGASSAALLRVDSPSSSSILFISGSGNVGIGTSTPQGRLDVSAGRASQTAGDLVVDTANNIVYVGKLDSVSGNTNFIFRNRLGGVKSKWDNAGAGSIWFGDFTNGYGVGIQQSGISTETTLPGNAMFHVNKGNLGGTVASFINGNVGIKTTIASASLHISGASSDALLRVESPASSSILFVSGSGRIGMGTSSPTASLHIVDAGSTSTNSLQINNLFRFRGDGVMVWGQSMAQGILNWDTGKVLLGGSSGNNLELYAGGSAKMFVSSSGLVGIGTTTPLVTLDVRGTAIFNNASGNSYNENIRLPEASTGYASIALGGAISASGTSATQWTILKHPAASSNTFAIRNNTVDYLSITTAGNVGIGSSFITPTARLQVRGGGATSATTTFLLQNSSPTNLMTVLDNGQFTFSSPIISLATSQSAFTISQSISASNTVGGQYYGVNITPTFFATTASQTETALRVAATFTGSTAAVGGQNIIADFGATSAGSQFTVTDVTSGSIYMVNDVSGLPIIEATSDWTVNMYNFPNLVFNKTGSQVNIFGTLRVSGSFILPLSQSVSPQTGSAYWSGSLLFVYDGTRYRSSSFA